MRRLGQFLVVESRDRLGHDRVAVAHALAAFVIAQRLEEIVLALVGDARHVVAAREVAPVAVAAMVFFNNGFTLIEKYGIGLLPGRRRRRQLFHGVGEPAAV